MMRRMVVLMMAVALLAGTGAAATFSSENTVAGPGENTTLGNLTVGVNNTSIGDVDSDSQFATSWNFTENGTAATGPVSIVVPRDASPQNNSFSVTVEWQNGSTVTTGPIQYSVPAVSNVTYNRANMSNDVSVGSDGVFGNLTLVQEGNSAEEIDVNMTGNLSAFLGAPGSVTMFRTRSYNLRVTFQVPRDTAFGHYAGQIDFVGENGTVDHTVNMSSVFRDDINPDIETVDIPDVMATTPLTVEAEVTDNLNVSTVEADIVREVSVTDGNTTTLQNQTLGTFSLGQRPQTDSWNVTVQDTDEIGTYYATLTANDTSGNTDNVTERFVIEGLNATNTVGDEIIFDTIRHDAESHADLLTNSFESPFNVTLTQFNYGNNASLQVGVLPPGSDAPRYFDDVNDTQQFSEAGRYRLVVNSLDADDINGSLEYNGQIRVDTPIQDPENPEVVFTGLVSAENRPDPTRLQIGEFNGYIGYGNTVPRFEEEFGSLDRYTDAVVYIGVMNSTRCLGVNSWSGCSTLSFGELERAESEREAAVDRAEMMTFQRNLALVGGLGFSGWVVLSVVTAGSLILFTKPKKENVNMNPFNDTGGIDN